MRSQMEGFTLIELLISITIVGVLGSVLLPNAFSVREKALYAAAESELRSLSTDIIACSDQLDYPADVSAGLAPPGCPSIVWPTGSEVPFKSTFDYENWDLGGGKRWIGVTFYGKSNSRASIPANTDLGPGLQKHGSGDNIAYSFALVSP